MSTHWESCWQIHPACATAEIVRLQAEVRRLTPTPREHVACKHGFTERHPHPDDPQHTMCWPGLRELLAPYRQPKVPEQSETVWCGGDEREPIILGPHTLTVVGVTGHRVTVNAEDFRHLTPPDRIPGSASWTAPCVDDPPVVLDALRPHP